MHHPNLGGCERWRHHVLQKQAILDSYASRSLSLFSHNCQRQEGYSLEKLNWRDPVLGIPKTVKGGDTDGKKQGKQVTVLLDIDIVPQDPRTSATSSATQSQATHSEILLWKSCTRPKGKTYRHWDRGPQWKSQFTHQSPTWGKLDPRPCPNTQGSQSVPNFYRWIDGQGSPDIWGNGNRAEQNEKLQQPNSTMNSPRKRRKIFYL